MSPQNQNCKLFKILVCYEEVLDNKQVFQHCKFEEVFTEAYIRPSETSMTHNFSENS